jgi:cytoskeletal protein CcmA (bactofilin family)
MSRIPGVTAWESERGPGVLMRESRDQELGEPSKAAGAERGADETAGGGIPPGGLLTQAPALRCALGADTSVTGRLSFNEPTRIDGRLRGEVRAADLLVVGENGVIEGTVRAPRLVVLGRIRGEVRGADQMEVAPGGRVDGTVETHSLVVREGGRLEGDCRVAPRSDAAPPMQAAAVPMPDA